MSPMWILLMCPLLALADMSVNLVVDDTATDFEVSGSDVQILSASERKTFKLNDYQLKNAVRKLFGKSPDNAYLRSPTGPLIDLYKTYHWDQVTRIMKPHQVKVLGLHTTPDVLMTRSFNNTLSPTPTTFNIEMARIVTNQVSTTSTNSDEFTIGGGVKFEVGIESVAGVEVDVNLQFKTTNSHSVSTGESVSVNIKQQLTIVLDPGQSVRATLSATKGYMLLQVDYTATLKGYAAVDYMEPYKGHHFWALDIGAVMEAAGISNNVWTTEIVRISFYSGGTMKIVDEATRSVLAERRMNNRRFLKFRT